MTEVSDVVGLGILGTAFAVVALMWLAVALAAGLARRQIRRMGGAQEEAERLKLDVPWWHLFNPRNYVAWTAWAARLQAEKEGRA